MNYQDAKSIPPDSDDQGQLPEELLILSLTGPRTTKWLGNGNSLKFHILSVEIISFWEPGLLDLQKLEV